MRIASCLAASALALALSGCAVGSDRSSDSEAGPAAPYSSQSSASEIDPCVVMDKAALDSAFGDDVFVQPRHDTTMSGDNICTTHAQGSARDFINVSISPGNASEFQAIAARGVGYQPVEGVPGPWDDSAGNCRASGCQLYVLKGNVIMGFLLAGESSLDAAALIATEATRKFS